MNQTSPLNRVRLAPAGQRRLLAQRGYALVELIIAISISAILAAYAAKESTEKNLDNITAGGAQYLKSVGLASQNLILNNFNNYAAGTPVPGVANALAPTLAELRALGRLPAGFPDVMPTRQQVRVDITRTNCVGPTGGPNCTVTALVCTTTPLTFGLAPGAGGVNIRHDLVQSMVLYQEGRGASSRIGDGANIRGPSGINSPNPNGNVEGIICSSSSTDVGFFNAFVRIGDTRDPTLQGNLTADGNLVIRGNTTLGDAPTDTTTVNGPLNSLGQLNVGPTANPCVRMQTDGRIATNCQSPTDIPAAALPGTPAFTGGVRTNDVVATGTLLAAKSASNPTSSDYALITAGAGGSPAKVMTSGNVEASQLVPTGSFAPGSACTTARAISRSTGRGLVYCNGTTWKQLALEAAAGDACAPNGRVATSTADEAQLLCLNGQYVPMANLLRAATVNTVCSDLGATGLEIATRATLICRANPQGGTAKWYRLRDVTTHLVFVAAFEVQHGVNVTKPACTSTAVPAPIAIIQLIPKAWGSQDGGQSFYAVDQGASWQINQLNGTGTPLALPTAIAQTYCYFP